MAKEQRNEKLLGALRGREGKFGLGAVCCAISSKEKAELEESQATEGEKETEREKKRERESC